MANNSQLAHMAGEPIAIGANNDKQVTFSENAKQKVITFSDIANNPQGLTTLNDTAKLFQRHAETLRRWVRGNKNPFIKPVTVNGFYYFKNSEILEYIEKQTATA